MSKSLSILVIVALAISMAVVYVRHESRQAYQVLHGLEGERDQLNIEYGQLLLERATWSVRESVEIEASAELDMESPDPAKIITLNIRQQESE